MEKGPPEQLFYEPEHARTRGFLFKLTELYGEGGLVDFFRIFLDSYPQLLEGLWITILLTVITSITGTILGGFFRTGEDLW